MELIERFVKPEKSSFFLIGPRGTGKYTFIKQTFTDAIYVDLLLPDVYRNHTTRPERLKELRDAHKDKNTVVIDEI